MEESTGNIEQRMDLEQQSIQEYLKPTASRKGETAIKLGPKLADIAYRSMYARAWEEAIRTSKTIDEFHKVMALGFDPHQQPWDSKRQKVDYRKDPEYEKVRTAVAERLSALSDSEIKKNSSDVQYILGVTHPNPYTYVTHTNYETRGRWPSKKTVPVERSERVFRPYKELIQELMNPQLSESVTK